MQVYFNTVTNAVQVLVTSSTRMIIVIKLRI